MSEDRMANWWKAVPCHFTWGLEGDTNADFKMLKNKAESILDDWGELDSYPPCYPLLLLGFLHVSEFQGAVRNPGEAMKVFQKVQKMAEVISNGEERLAFIAVCLANQLWTANIAGNDDLPNFDREFVLTELRKAWDEATQERKTYLDAVAVWTLLRIRLKKYKEAERRCRDILRVIPTESEWHHWLGQLIGRRARANVGSSRVDYEDLDEEIQCYRKALELDPSNEVARLDLADALVKKPGKEAEAWKNVEMVEGNSFTVLIKKGRFYRMQNENTTALRILMEGTKLKNPRGELFFQIALVYSSLAFKAGDERNYDQKNGYLRQQLQYFEKTLQAEPGHHLAMIKKAVVLGLLRRNGEAETAYKRAIKFLETDQTNLVEAQFRYAEFITARNRHQVTREGAQMYEKVISTATEILNRADDDEMNDVRTGMKKYASKAKTKLQEFYGGDPARMDELEKQLENFHL